MPINVCVTYVDSRIMYINGPPPDPLNRTTVYAKLMIFKNGVFLGFICMWKLYNGLKKKRGKKGFEGPPPFRNGVEYRYVAQA